MSSTLDLELHVHRLHIRESGPTSASLLGSWDSSIFSVTQHKHTLARSEVRGSIAAWRLDPSHWVPMLHALLNICDRSLSLQTGNVTQV